MPKFRRLYWDIETSPNVGFFWRPGYKVSLTHENIIEERSIICICWKWAGKKTVHHLTWDRDHNDKAMLARFLPVINSADESVAHYGDHFDLPWIRTRGLIHRLRPIFPTYTTIDTVQMARRGFNFNSTRLDYLSKLLVGHGKIHTDFELWKRVYFNKRGALKEMVGYCKVDVVRLEEVFDILEQYAPHLTNRSVLAGGPKWACPKCTSDRVECNKTRVTAMGTIRRQMHCRKCGRIYTISDLSYRHYKEAKEAK